MKYNSEIRKLKLWKVNSLMLNTDSKFNSTNRKNDTNSTLIPASVDTFLAGQEFEDEFHAKPVNFWKAAII